MDSAFKIPVPRQYSNSYEVPLCEQENYQFTRQALPRLLSGQFSYHVDKDFPQVSCYSEMGMEEYSKGRCSGVKFREAVLSNSCS